MKNYLFCLIAVIIYIIIILLMILKIKDYSGDPKKYNEIKGWSKYRQSFWYEPLSEYHRKIFSKNYVAPIIVFIPLMIGLTVAYYLIGYLIQKYFLIPQNALFLHGDGLLIGVVGALFYSISLSYWIIYHCKSPLAIASTITAFNSKSRSDDWKKLILMMLVSSIICIPVMLGGINAYGYATEKEIVINEFLKINEQHISYIDIDNIDVQYRSDTEGTEYYFSYVITVNDTKIDVMKLCSEKEMIYIHNQILNHEIAFQKGIISDDIYTEMEKCLKDSQLELVQLLFEIEK